MLCRYYNIERERERRCFIKNEKKVLYKITSNSIYYIRISYKCIHIILYIYEYEKDAPQKEDIREGTEIGLEIARELSNRNGEQ